MFRVGIAVHAPDEKSGLGHVAFYESAPSLAGHGPMVLSVETEDSVRVKRAGPLFPIEGKSIPITP